ncbi:hypothetical protein B0H11DRAFT_1968554 [Mycena galericulata]|nr:hypothetical protein B0H11DRAFT_1968554 [Mycena galericulata]
MSVYPRAFIRNGTSQTTSIVRSVLNRHPDFGLTTKELYEKAHAMFPDAYQPAPPLKEPTVTLRSTHGRIIQPMPQPPYRSHPIRSIRYLKTVVLKELQEQRLVEKFVTHQPPDGDATSGIGTRMVWRWRLLEAPSERGSRMDDGKLKPPRPDVGTPVPMSSRNSWGSP